ncbi:hypothetical protein AGABI1DRAFT_132571 [Agaricus bisporus var. burnettii JB137-S8]|uniref:Uncharacterized protein n=1 Tax=Agaricus bisporus var. burnettii (strain JB137-S8 / ATCC MYA-4627 / FGSC 10392) TaxID=597362 RepID=K5WX41_AGABU|nr:hypothetical protein AGABI2DRAFT_120952 [Agaricus bisporus var. bisporus H97]XP_007334265.1 uncharacterized protein AGABI1DRAFT_132571 [Agaricus bisporus var. burnettii JB137-S8]EKM75122.1 hypothetical protein AGABI1DRAFT_132571 [Agaricus bisporus var. burnettii JB137-S8]EKV44855.1 hypothetical protein AGABI2DRAFT_120952 [Agaricus bisporus var. bisporus H97]
MRSSLTIFALIVSTAVGAFAGAIERDHLFKRGGPEICTANLDGSGEPDAQVTKDCCAAVDHEAYFNEAFKQCWPYSGPAGNSIDTGAMVDCCSSRDRGSRAV